MCLLEQAGKKKEVKAKRIEAETMRARAIRQFEHAKEVLTLVQIEKRLTLPEQRSGLQFICDKAFI